jgi:hypothetical protein
VRYQIVKRMWAVADASYGIGLPVEVEGAVIDIHLLRQQFGQPVLDRVTFDRGRVRPAFALDLSAGAEFGKREHRSLRVQASVANATNRLNVIDFSGLFSGTAPGLPRWASMRAQFEF